MVDIVHPFYEGHRDAMEAVMRHRLDLAEPLLRDRAHASGIAQIRRQVMDEFEVVLTQMPYVGGAASRMTDFFMRLIGFIAISRVLRRHGVSPSLIGDIERETYRAQLLIEPAADRLAEGRQFMSPENRRRLREQAAHSASEAHQREFPDDFVYEFVEPGPGDRFEFGINYTSCGFCKFAARHGDQAILPNICGLDVDDYAVRGIHLERTQTLAGGARHCDFRFSSLQADDNDVDSVCPTAPLHC